MHGHRPQVGREQLGRLYRITKELGLSAAAQDLIRRAVLEGLETALGLKEREASQPVRGSVELRIRKKVEAGALWTDIESLTWEMLEECPQPEVGARIVELAFLHGSSQDVVAVFRRLLKTKWDFYFHIDLQVRTYLTLRLWMDKSDGVLQNFLTSDRGSAMVDIERLFVYFNLTAKEEVTSAFMFFRQFEESLFRAIDGFGSRLRMSRGDLAVHAARLALKLDYSIEAGRLVDTVEKEDPAFPVAMDLFLKVEVERDESGYCVYGKELIKETRWAYRVKMFYRFLAEARRLGTLKQKSRPALNELLRDPMKWVPKESEAWAAMAQMLVANIDLEPMLPQLMHTFRTHALVFHKKLLDRALWNPLVNLVSKNPEQELYWRSLSRFHLFVNSDEKAEPYLWDAFEGLEKLEEIAGFNPPIRWYELQKAAMAHIGKTPEIEEVCRQRLLRQLAVATKQKNLVGSDLLRYLDAPGSPPYRVLERLHGLVHGTSHHQIELRILQKKAAISHLKNRDLDSLWSLALNWKNYDLAWRVATILKARDALHSRAEHAWSISGEKRDQFLTLQPNQAVIDRLMTDFDQAEKRLIHAILRVGPLIPDLCALIDPGVRPRKLLPNPQGSAAQVAEDQMAKLNWLHKSKRQYFYGFEGAMTTGLRMPSFMQCLPSNVWSLMLVRLIDRVGISAWGWSMKRLGHYLDEAVPKMVAGQRSYPIKIGKWLRQLTPGARQSWYDLPQMVAKFDEDRAIEIQAIFVIRLCLLLNQNNYQALASLKAMRAPVRIIWNVENWLLSEDYTEIRQHYRTGPRIMVPDSLQQLPSIVAAQPGTSGILEN